MSKWGEIRRGAKKIAKELATFLANYDQLDAKALLSFAD